MPTDSAKSMPGPESGFHRPPGRANPIQELVGSRGAAEDGGGADDAGAGLVTDPVDGGFGDQPRKPRGGPLRLATTPQCPERPSRWGQLESPGWGR